MTLTDKALNDLDDGTLAQVIGTSLKAEAQNTDVLVSSLHYELQPSGHLHFIARKNGRQDWQLQVTHFRLIRYGPQVLGQAGAAKGKTGFEVSGRDVELGILTEDLHHLVRIDGKRFADVTD